MQDAPSNKDRPVDRDASAAALDRISDSACCERISTDIFQQFLARLKAASERAGGALSTGQIAGYGERFLAEIGHFQPLFEQAYDRCTTAREMSKWTPSRQRLFERVLIKRFAHLFPARDGDDGTQGDAWLSRRIIPGFVTAIHMMIGPVLYEQCERKTRAIVNRYSGEEGAINWVEVYNDPETAILDTDVLLVVAHYFKDFTKRRDWFMTVVNGHLAPAEAGAPDEYWQLTKPAFHRLMHALFAEMHLAFIANDGASILKRHGERAYRTLDEFFTKLERLA